MTDETTASLAAGRIDAQRIPPPELPIGSLLMPDVRDAREAMERTMLDGELDVDALVRYRDRLLDRLPLGVVPLLSWPRSWFIPQQADFQQHWPTPPPPSHRYDWASANSFGGEPSASRASAADGRLFAWGFDSARGLSSLGIARTGIFLQPSETLASYRIGADVEVTAEHRWAFLATSAVGSCSVSYRCTAFLIVFLWNPADGSWELLRPFAARTLVRTHHTGQGIAAVSSEHRAFDDLRLEIQLQGGRTYAIGVSFEAEVDATLLDPSGKPYAQRPGDDVRLWASMAGAVPKITASPRVVWIP